jgi:hypothetical protein
MNGEKLWGSAGEYEVIRDRKETRLDVKGLRLQNISNISYCHDLGVTIDGLWIGELIY